jgi:hypothetical protein
MEILESPEIAVTAQMQGVEARCRCGQVSLELVGQPMMRATCYCDSCQAAGKILGELPGAPAIVDQDGGTDFTLYRKDRVGRVGGIEHLQPHRLTAESPTRRMVADCCNTPMLLDFTKGFWLSVYPGCLSAADRQESAGAGITPDASGDLGPHPRPTLRAQSAPFMARLFLSWAVMGFRTPKLGW